MKKILLVLITAGLFALTLNAQSDDCAGATFLTAAEMDCATTNQSLTGTTVGATTIDGVNLACIDGTVQEGVWYSFVAQSPEFEIINNNALDPFVAIFNDVCPPTAADLVYCDQLDILDDPLEADDLLTTGDTYLIWIGFSGGTAAFDICFTNPAAPANDDCLMPENFVGDCSAGGGLIVGSTQYASPEDATFNLAGCIDPGTDGWEGLWYSFESRGYDIVIEDVLGTSPYIVIINSCDFSSPTTFFSYCGQAPVDLTTAPHGDNILNPGDTYYMWVGFDNGLEEDFELCIDNPEPPANDECLTAIPIDPHCSLGMPMAPAITGDIYGAFPDDFNFAGCIPSAIGNGGFEGIWYRFVVEGHDLLVETQGNEDPYIMIFNDCPASGGLPIACFQTENGNPTNQGAINGWTGTEMNNLFLEALIGTEVYMWVGFDGGLDSTFTICIDNPIPPPNDDCADAEDITDFLNCPDGTAGVLGTTNFSTIENDWVGLGEPPPCFNQTANPPFDEIVWYRFTAPGVDLEISDLMGNNPSFAIFNWVDCNEPDLDDLIVCGEMPYNFIDDPDDLFDVGREYIMLIAFPGGWAETDSFELCVNIPEPPPNDLCENAIPIDGNLDCPEIDNNLVGWTTNASQQGTYWVNQDPAMLGCALDTFEDDGVWYSFTAVGSDIEIEDIGGNEPTVLLMNNSFCRDSLFQVFCQQAPISAEFGEVGNNALIIGNEYLMYVTFQGGELESDTFELCIDNDGMCNSPTPPSSYCQTTPLCGVAALDGYCMTMEANGLGETWPGCSQNVAYHDPNWFSFVAGAENLSLSIQIGGCVSGSGVQIEMYEIDCTTDLGPNQPYCPGSDLGAPLANCIFVESAQIPGSNPIFNVPTEFGHIYALVFDGWAGDLCTIEIQVLEGGNPPVLDTFMLNPPTWDPTAFPFEGDTICAGAEDVLFAITEEIPGACRYDWTVDGIPVNGTNGLEEFIDFPVPGNFEVCFFASNFCDSTLPICIPIVVAALDPYIVNDTICEGDDYIWLGPFGEALDFNPAFDSEIGGDFEFTNLAVNAAGCEIDAFLFLHILEENDGDSNNDQPTQIDTVICFGDLPFEYGPGDVVGGAFPVEGVLLGHEFDRPWAHGDFMCDSFFLLDLYALQAIINYQVYFPLPSWIFCVDSVITVCPSDIAGNPIIYPDPFQYPDVEVDYQWLRKPTNDSVGTNSDCLVVTFEDFENSEHEFELYVTMRKGGRPSAGCTFGPFEVELDLVDFIPDSMDIIGPDTVCVGPEYPYTIEQFNPTDLFPFTTDYDWDLSNFPGAIRTEIEPDSSVFTFTQVGIGQICVTALDQCSPSATHCKTVVVATPPPGDAGTDMEECTNTYTLDANDVEGVWYTSDRPFGASSPVFADSSDANTAVTVISKGVYTFAWVTNAYGCNDTAYVDIDFIEPMSLVAPAVYTCDNVNENYTAVFTFTGGVEPFVVTSSNGTLTDTTFTSDLIPEGDTVVVLITDAQDCIGSFVITEMCACATEGAEMNLNPIESCGEVCVTIVPFTAPVPDPNDAVIFVLHTNSDNTLGTVIDENITGEFCYTTGGAIQFGTQYYVSIVVGNASGSTVDLADRCLDIAPGQPVIWYEVPAPDAGSDDATCDKVYQLNVTNSNFPGSWEIISAGTNVTFSDQNSPTSSITALGCGVVELRWNEGNGGMANMLCQVSSDVTIEFYCNPTNGTLNFSCNMAQDELTVTFALNGTGPFMETNGRGTITGTTFEEDGLPLLTVDTFFFVDGNGCQLVVPVPEADCNCLPIIMPDTVCGLSIDLLSDGTGNGGNWAVSSEPVGETATIDNPNSRAINITVTNYGTYCFTWTEVGNLCQGTAEICIPFVNSPQVDPASIQYMCNDIYEGYTISFDISDGHLPSYKVTDEFGLPLGSIIGNTFTSREIPSTQSVIIWVFDGFGCDTVILDLTHDCGCFKAFGDFDVSPLNLCDGDQTAVVYDATNEDTDANDAGIYILYTDLANPLTSIINESPSGVFSFMDPPMVLGTTYYISYVLGNEFPVGSGQVDYTDPCVIVSAPKPVTWYEAADPIMLTASEIEFTCIIDMMNLTVTATNLGDYDIEWTTTNGMIESGDENSANPQINGPGTYTVTLTHSIAGCLSMAPITVDVSADVPTPVIVPPAKLTCANTQIQLSGQGSDTGPTIRYEWTGPGIIGSNTDLDIMIDATGTYTLTIIDDSNGCRISTSVVVEDDLVEPNAEANSPDLLDCNTTQVTVSGQGSATGVNITYSWSVISATGNIIGSTTGRDIMSDVPGTYQLTVTDLNNGCTSIATASVNSDPSVISGANISVRQPGCGGEDDGQITFASIIGGTGPFMYSFDGGATFDIIPGLTDLGSGVYDLVVTDANGCIFTETVILTAPFDFTIDLGETIVIELGDTAFVNALTNLPDSLRLSVSWNPLYDTINQNNLSQSFIPDLGQHSVSLTVTNTNGCIEQDNVLVVVKFAERLYIPNVMRPSSTNNSNQRIHIFADPESVSEIHSFAIYDRWGERMFIRTDLPVTLDYDPTFAWDGMWKGEPAPQEVYVYYADVEFITGVRKLVKGEFTLIR